MNGKYFSLVIALFVANSVSINAKPWDRLIDNARAVGQAFISSFKDGCEGVRDLWTGDSIKTHNADLKATLEQEFDSKVHRAGEFFTYRKQADHVYVDSELAAELNLPRVKNGFNVYNPETGGIVDPKCLIIPEQLSEVRASYVDAKVNVEALSLDVLPRLEALPSLFKSWITAQDASDAKAVTIAGRALALSAVVGGMITTAYLLKSLFSRKKSQKNSMQVLAA